MILQLKVQRTSLSHADLVYSEMTPEEKVRNETKQNETKRAISLFQPLHMKRTQATI